MEFCPLRGAKLETSKVPQSIPPLRCCSFPFAYSKYSKLSCTVAVFRGGYSSWSMLHGPPGGGSDICRLLGLGAHSMRLRAMIQWQAIVSRPITTLLRSVLHNSFPDFLPVQRGNCQPFHLQAKNGACGVFSPSEKLQLVKRDACSMESAVSSSVESRTIKILPGVDRGKRRGE